MNQKTYRLGEVIRILILGEMTICIVVSDLVKMKTLTKGMYYLSLRGPSDGNHGMSRMMNGIMHMRDCYELLIGDKKVWAWYYV